MPDKPKPNMPKCVTDSISAAAAAAASTGKNTGYKVLMISQAIEDAQYGFVTIATDIPGIA